MENSFSKDFGTLKQVPLNYIKNLTEYIKNYTIVYMQVDTQNCTSGEQSRGRDAISAYILVPNMAQVRYSFHSCSVPELITVKHVHVCLKKYIIVKINIF